MSDLPSLRERKKAKTRAALERVAMELFASEGYEATTVEQIAAAAEVSPSTFFRYFPTKEALLFADDLDGRIVANFHSQPTDADPLSAILGALREAAESMTPSEAANLRRRNRLIVSSPDLRAAQFENATRLTGLIAALVSEREGVSESQFSVQVFAESLQGTVAAVYRRWTLDEETDLAASLEEAFALVRNGLPLPSPPA